MRIEKMRKIPGGHCKIDWKSMMVIFSWQNLHYDFMTTWLRKPNTDLDVRQNH